MQTNRTSDSLQECFACLNIYCTKFPIFKAISISKELMYFSHPYMTTGKTIALTRRTFVDKVMFQLFNMLSRLVITFLPRSKCLLISWLQAPSAVLLEHRKIKSATVSADSPSICHEVMGPCQDLCFLNVEL